MLDGLDVQTYWRRRLRLAARRLRVASSYYLRSLYREIVAKNLFLWAQAIAFKVLVTIVPIVILATGLAGRLLRGNDAFATVARFIHDFLPPNQSNQLVEFLNQLQQASGTIVGVGGLGLFLSAVSLFITLRIAVSNAFEQDWHEGRTLLGSYVFDVRMVLQVGVFFLLTIAASVAAQSLLSAGWLQQMGLDPTWVQRGWRDLISSLSVFVPFFLTTAMFFQLYYFVPIPHPRKRSALTGALTAGVLWEAAKQAFTYYATYVGRFDRYGASSSLEAVPGGDGGGLAATEVLGNTFGLIIAFVFWVYFSGIVLMIGAVVASLREHRYVTRGRLPGEPPAGGADSNEAPAGDADRPSEVGADAGPGARDGGTRNGGTGSGDDDRGGEDERAVERLDAPTGDGHGPPAPADAPPEPGDRPAS
jgi:membrane protein